MAYAPSFKNPLNGRLTVIVVILAIGLVLPWIFMSPFSSNGEPREALAAQGILQTGNWILPTRYGDEIVTKPPLFHWLVALASLPEGRVSEGAARLPSALAGIVTVLCLYFMAARYAAPQLGFVSAIVLLGAFLWHTCSLRCRVDLVLSCFMATGLMSLWYWEERKLKGWPWLSVLLLTGATLCKGPVGLVLPAGIFFLYLFWLKYNPRQVFPALLKLGVPVALLSLVWYGLAYQAAGQRFLDTVIAENFSRFTSTMEGGDNPHAHSVWYLYGVFLGGLFPWTLLLLLDLAALLRLRRGALAGAWPALRSKIKSAPKLSVYCWLVVICMLGFFSIPASKRAEYLLPAFPFASFLLAQYGLFLLHHRPGVVKAAAVSLACVVCFAYGLCLLAVSDFLWAGLFVKDPWEAMKADFYIQALRNFLLHAGAMEAVLLSAPLLIALFVVYRHRRLSSSMFSAVAALVLYFSVLLVVDGLVWPHISATLSPNRFAADVLKIADPTQPWYSYRSEFYGVNFYLQGRLNLLKRGCAPSGGNGYVVVNNFDYADLFSSLGTDYDLKTMTKSSFPVERPGEWLYLVRVAKRN